MSNCRSCSVVLTARKNIYCSNACQLEYQYTDYILRWKNGMVNGNRGISAKNISKHIRRYLFEKYNNACSGCNWSVVHPVSGNVPLEIDHIDGDSENSTETNLRLLCPNCHALTTNYRNLNIGNGRMWRRLKYIKQN